ncbi:MAG: hypothetical protein AB7N76_01960 [Planctomycetota bacterium]
MSAARRKRTLAKLGEVCAKIEKILAGQELTLADVELPQERDPGPSPLERLEAMKRLLNETLAELSRGEPRRCLRCGAPLPDAVLDEMPWAFRCAHDAPCVAPEQQ